MKPIEIAYLNSLTEKEKKAYEIAKQHLGSLFTLEKTNGFIQWKNQQNNNSAK